MPFRIHGPTRDSDYDLASPRTNDNHRSADPNSGKCATRRRSDGFVRMSQRKRQQIDIAAINFLSFMGIPFHRIIPRPLHFLPSTKSSMRQRSSNRNASRILIERILIYAFSGLHLSIVGAAVARFVRRSSLGRCGREANTSRRRVCAGVRRKLLGPIHSSFTFV